MRARALAAMAIVAATSLAGPACSRDDPEVVDTTSTSTTSTSIASTTVTTPSTATSSTSTSTSTSTSATTEPPRPSTTAPLAGGPAVQIRRGNPDRRAVALTFDAGSDVGSTTTILDVLAAEGIQATFGVTGAWADEHPDLVRRIVADGHQVLNHSYDHLSFTGSSTGRAPLSAAQRADQLARTETVLAGLGATARPWFRPPYGDVDESVDADVGAAGYRYEVLWTIDSLGWKGTPADEVVDRCLDGAVPGAIVLLHVGAASTDAAALPAIIDGLRAQGYSFDTVAGVVR